MQDKNMPLNLVPAAGMKFTTYDKAWDFYNNYARCAGFGHTQEGKTQDKCLHCLLKRMDTQADCVRLSPGMSEDIKKDWLQCKDQS